MRPSRVSAIVRDLEAIGVRFRLDGQKVKARLPETSPPKVLRSIESLRSRRSDVAALLRKRRTHMDRKGGAVGGTCCAGDREWSLPSCNSLPACVKSSLTPARESAHLLRRALVRLSTLIDKRIRTPRGTGRLVGVSSGWADVLLDGSEEPTRFDTADIWPPYLM